MAVSREIIAKTITSAVKDRFKNDPETLTVNSIRSEVEERLGLKDGFLKGDAHWKGESAKLVKSMVEKLNEEGEGNDAESDAGMKDELEENVKDDEEEPSRLTPKNSRKTARRAAPSDDDSELDKGPPPPPKKRKTSTAAKEPKSKSEPKRTTKNAAKVEPSDSELSEVDEKELLTPESEGKEDVEAPVKKEDAEMIHTSDLSEVDDPVPVPKRRKSRGEGKSEGKAESKPKAKAASKGKKATEPLSPAEEKIKTLQNQLLKCGIRKIWSRELAKFSTSKEKIKHLEGILQDIGMTGRFSLEKAKAIKERRELEEEVAAVQEGAKDWGRSKGRLQTRSSISAPKSSKAPPTNSALDEIDFLVDRSDSD